jgi:hypothetical protein
MNNPAIPDPPTGPPEAVHVWYIVEGSGRGGQQQRARIRGGEGRTKKKKNLKKKLVVCCVGRLCQLYKWSAPSHHTRGGIHPTTTLPGSLA